MTAHVKPDGLGMLPRIGEPESNLIPGMAAPRPLEGAPAAFMAPSLASMPDTSIGPVALQQPLWWNYDFDPATKNARATFLGINQPGTLGAISATSLAVTGAISAASASLTTPLPVASGGTNDSGTAWTAYTPSLSATSGTGIVASTNNGQYKVIGKTCFWVTYTVLSSLGTAATALRISLPITTGPASLDKLVNAFDIVNGSALLVARIPGGSIPLCIVSTVGGAFPVSVNGGLICSGVYETA